MKESFFNGQGILSLDESVASQPSFKKIMEDGIVTEEEISEQANHLRALFFQVEDALDEIQLKLVKELLVESNVLQYVFVYSQLQNFKF